MNSRYVKAFVLPTKGVLKSAAWGCYVLPSYLDLIIGILACVCAWRGEEVVRREPLPHIRKGTPCVVGRHKHSPNTTNATIGHKNRYPRNSSLKLHSLFPPGVFYRARRQLSRTVKLLPRIGWQRARRKLMHLVESLSVFSVLYYHPIPSTALKVEKLSCVSANSKSAC